MTERYLIATGDVGTAANWDGGVALPDVADDCYANGFTGTFTASRTAASWRTTAGSVAVAGGGWACSTAGVAIGGNIIAGTTSAFVVGNATGTVTVTGNVTGSAVTASVNAITKSGAGRLDVVGTVTGGGQSAARGINSTAGETHIVGNVTGGGNNANAQGIIYQTAGTGSVTGTVTGGAGSSAYGVAVSWATSITITGDCVAVAADAARATGGGSIVINGSCSGGTGSSSANGVENAGTGTVTISGNSIGGTSTATDAHGAVNSSTGILTISGYAIGSPSGGSSAGVQGYLSATTTVGSIRTSVSGVTGAVGKVFLSSLTTGTLQGVNAALTVKTFYPTDFAGLLPAAANVRSGTVYNLTLSTGTLAVPAAGSVLNGVAVDAGTGTYVTVSINDVESGVTFGAASALTGVFGKPTAAQVLNGVGYGANSTEFTGTVVLPAVASVLSGVTFGASSESTGTYVVVATGNVRSGTTFGAASSQTGTLAVPTAANVLSGVAVGATTGTYVTVSINDVEAGVTFGAASALTGVFGKPTAAQVLIGVGFGANNTQFIGTVVLPSINDVEFNVTFGPSSTLTGVFQVPPSEDYVIDGTGYGANGTEFTGNYVTVDTFNVRLGVLYANEGQAIGELVLPAEADVEFGVVYDVPFLSPKTGTFTSPSPGSVLSTVSWGAGGTEFTGTYVVTVAGDVRLGVAFGPDGSLTGTLESIFVGSGTPAGNPTDGWLFGQGSVPACNESDNVVCKHIRATRTFFADLSFLPEGVLVTSATADTNDPDLEIESVTVLEDDVINAGCTNSVLTAGRAILVVLSGGTESEDEVIVTIHWIQDDGDIDAKDVRLIVAGTA